MRDAAAMTGHELLPWDYWGRGRAWSPDAPPSADEARAIDAAARDMAGGLPDRESVAKLLERHPWLRPISPLLSFPGGQPVEVAVELGTAA